MKLKKILVGLFALIMTISLTSCDIWGENGAAKDDNNSSENNNSDSSSGSGSGCEGLPGKEEWTLDDVNAYLNSQENFDMSTNGNFVSVIPFRHINGPRDEWNFFALVNFEYRAARYYKYQVTFLSCTCRNPIVNYWSTMYVELSRKAGSPDDVKILNISFDYDNQDPHSHRYQAGFWGDSNPIDGSLNKETNSEVTYEDIKNGYINHFVGLTYGEIKNWDVVEDIQKTTDPKLAEMRHTLDILGGASVSTNNILRCLHSICEYHNSKERYK